MIKVAVIGAGDHSRTNHGPALRRCKEELGSELSLVAVCDLQRDRAQRYAEDFGFQSVYEDFVEMVEHERPDGVVAVTPIEHTEAITSQLMQMGVRLVVEKPPGLNCAQARRLTCRAAELNVPHMVSFNRRFGPAFTRARNWLSERPDKPPVLVSSRMLRHARYDERFAPGTAIHAIDNVLAFMGQPLDMVAKTYAVGERDIPFFDARLRFGVGVASFVIAPTSGTVDERIEIVGQDYSLVVDVGACTLSINEGGEQALFWSADLAVPEWEKNGTLDETRTFLRALRGGCWEPTLRDALIAMEVAETMQESQRRSWNAS